MLFYDTCSLLKELQNAFKEKFYISNITLKEIENIKTSALKDEDVKYRARQLAHLLDEKEKEYEIIDFSSEYLKFLPEIYLEEINNDIKIISSALYIQKTKRIPITFVTEDLCCKRLAASVNLKVKFLNDKDLSNYKGFKELLLDTEEKIGNFYNNIYSTKNLYNLLTNQYLFIKDKNGEVLDKFFYNGKTLEQLKFSAFNSKQLGKIKAKDEYQSAAMDSLKRNKISLLRGPAGTGKSYLAMGFLFDLLEKDKIQQIIIFCKKALLLRSEFQIHGSVLPCGSFPRYVLCHVSLHHLVPVPAIREIERLGAVDRVIEQPGFISVKGESVACLSEHIVRLYGIFQSACLAHHRDGSIAHGDQLRKSARLKERRNKRKIACRKT
jgi:DNA replication protein DnaC